MTKRSFTIQPAEFPSDSLVVRSLFSQYAKSLTIDLSFQNFADELDFLPGSYSAPDGIILIASADEDYGAIGCVALRPLRVEGDVGRRRVCEMKRLYCWSETRGKGVGKRLAEEVIKRAEEMGYSEMRLDTLPSMVAARKMYASMGFVEMEAYYETPIGETIFMRKMLGRESH